MEVRLNPLELGVVVELTFQHEFSNVLNVFIKVIRKGNLSDCIAWISKLPSVSILSVFLCEFYSVQSLDQLGHRRAIRADSTEILSQSFL